MLKIKGMTQIKGEKKWAILYMKCHKLCLEKNILYMKNLEKTEKIVTKVKTQIESYIKLILKNSRITYFQLQRMINVNKGSNPDEPI